MYDKDKLIERIWQNPNAITGLQMTLRGNVWQTSQYPDGTDDNGRRPDRTTMKRGTDSKGNATIWVHCNGDFGAFQGGTIWAYLHWRFNTNEHLDVLQRIGDTYGVEPDTTGYTDEQKRRAQQRRDEKAVLAHISAVLTKELHDGGNGTTARAYVQNRGLKTSPRLGAWNSKIKARLLAQLPPLVELPAKTIEDMLRRLFPTGAYDDQHRWHDNTDDYQLSIPYTNGSGNVIGFVLRRTSTNEALPKYKYSKDMAKGGYCEALRGGDAPVILVEGILDAEAMKQYGFANVLALGGQTPTDDKTDAAKSTIQTLLRYNAKKVIYIPDYEYKNLKDDAGNVVGVEPYPTADATRRTIAALLPYMTGTATGSGFVSLRVANLETADARKNKTKVDADTFLQSCGAEAMRRVLDDAAQWYEYELHAIVQQHTGDADGMAIAATDVYCRIQSYAQRNRLKDAITAAKSGYLAQLKAAGLNAAALTLIDKDGQHSTWAARMGEVVDAMAKTSTPERMGQLLTKAERIQHADTYNAFADQVNATRETLHAQVARKPDYLQTSWALYRERYNKGTQRYEPHENRKISFAPAAVSVVAAPTNHGKTLVLLQTAIDVAKTTGKKYLYISFENDAEQLYIRAITAYMGDVWKADEPNPRGEVRAAIKADDMPAVLFDSGNTQINIGEYIQRYWVEVAPRLALVRTDADIDALCNNVAAQVEGWRNAGEEVGGIFIDYLQLLHYPAIHAHSRTDEVKGICDRLNDMAKATGLPVIVAAQFNRDATRAGGDKLDGIELANIGESAGIENIAEDVYLVWQVDKINPNSSTYTNGKNEFSIPKHLTRSRRCFVNPDSTDAEDAQLRRGYLYVENLKARDYATGGYCLLRYHGAAGAIIGNGSYNTQNAI